MSTRGRVRGLIEDSVPLPQGPPVKPFDVAIFLLAPPFWSWWAAKNDVGSRLLVAHLLTACGYVPGLIYMVYVTRRDNSAGEPR